MSRSYSMEEVAVPPSGEAPRPQPLAGTRVVLEPLDPKRHGDALHLASHADEEARRIWTFLPDGPFADTGSFRKWAARMASDADRLPFAVRDRGSDRLGGMAMYLDIRPAHGAIEIGYIWFAPFLQRTPQATEALFLMLRHAFDDLRYRRVQWRCNVLNERSRAAAVRLGFTFEGVFHQHMVVKGRNRDTAWYSILDHEWPAIRPGFERWLAPANFDSRGTQMASLRRLNEAVR